MTAPRTHVLATYVDLEPVDGLPLVDNLAEWLAHSLRDRYRPRGPDRTTDYWLARDGDSGVWVECDQATLRLAIRDHLGRAASEVRVDPPCDSRGHRIGRLAESLDNAREHFANRTRFTFRVIAALREMMLRDVDSAASDAWLRSLPRGWIKRSEVGKLYEAAGAPGGLTTSDLYKRADDLFGKATKGRIPGARRDETPGYRYRVPATASNRSP